MELAMKDIGSQAEKAEDEYIEGSRMSFKTVHSYLYSFSLEKLNNLVNLKYFAFFYCHYFKEGVLASHRIERKSTMRKHFTSYASACNLILRLCQDTLRRSIDMFPSAM